MSALRLFLHFAGASVVAGAVLGGSLIPTVAAGMPEGEAGAFGVLLGVVAVLLGGAWAYWRGSRS